LCRFKEATVATQSLKHERIKRERERTDAAGYQLIQATPTYWGPCGIRAR